MTRRIWRIAAIGVLSLTAGVSMLAQRGGGFGGFFGGDRYNRSTPANARYDGRFTFLRVSYIDTTPDRQGGHWAHDYPTGEAHLSRLMSELTSTNTRLDMTNVMSLHDPDIFKFPVAYMSEPGYWNATDEDIKNLHDYLAKGGFIIFDDFGEPGRSRSAGHWANLESVMSRAFPTLHWIDMDDDAIHPIFHSFFDIDEPKDIPQYYDVGLPLFRGLFEDNDMEKGRMLAFANYNTDISEFWEYSNTGLRPVAESNEAYKLGINQFIYGITH